MTQKRQIALKYTLLTAAAGLIIACWLVLAGACGPAAPAAQTATSTDETLNTPTPTPDSDLAADGLPAVPPPLPTLTRLDREYTNVDSYLRDKIEQYEAAQAASGASGASGNSEQPTPELIQVSAFTDTGDRVEALQRFMKDNGSAQLSCGRGPEGSIVKGQCSAYIPVSLLRLLAKQPGVVLIMRTDIVQKPASGLSSPTLQQTVVDAHGVTPWRLAGATGSEVKVGIIDFGFKDFRTRLPRFAGSVHPFCYDSSGNLDKINISVCEDNSGGSSDNYHGTIMAEAITSVAPNVTLYIANANIRTRIKSAVDWMVENNVDIINYSLAGPWEGPGDGTSPFNDASSSSYGILNSLSDAISGGILWLAAAGNTANEIWFKRGISMSANRYVDFDARANTQWCNNITQRLQSGTTYTFHIRWEGAWGNEDSDFTLRLYRISPQRGWVARQVDVQNGSAMQFPREVMSYTPSISGQYCLAVTLAAGDSVPAWLQLWAVDLNLQYGDGSGSIMNPAESANGGMLAVGAASLDPTPVIRSNSSRGPAPEPGPRGRTKPDIVGGNASAADGTSIATAHVAGMAALVIQKLGSQSQYDTPAEIAGYLLRHNPIQPGSSNPNNTWGWGFAKLPAPPPPTGLALQLDNSNADNLLLNFTRSNWDASPNHRYHFVLERFDTAKGKWLPFASKARVTASPVTFSGLRQGNSYLAKGKRCVAVTTVNCGDWSNAPYTQLWLPRTPTPTPTPTVAPVCGQPQNFRRASFDTSTRTVVYRWDAPSGGGLTVTGYQTEWREVTDKTPTEWDKNSPRRLPLKASARSETVGPFGSWINGRKYQNRVYAICGSAMSQPSNHTTLTYPRPTPASVPALGAPGGLTAVAGARAGTVNLTWTPGANATIHWIYGVRLGPNNRVVWAGTGASGSYTVTGLPRGADYAFTVIAGRTVAGRDEWSSWTGWQSVTLPPASARLSPR